MEAPGIGESPDKAPSRWRTRPKNFAKMSKLSSQVSTLDILEEGLFCLKAPKVSLMLKAEL